VLLGLQLIDNTYSGFIAWFIVRNGQQRHKEKGEKKVIHSNLCALIFAVVNVVKRVNAQGSQRFLELEAILEK
jgi:hypothetical protein